MIRIIQIIIVLFFYQISFCQMRDFNTREKAIIKRIVEIDVSSMSTASRFLQDNFFTEENQKALVVNHATKDVLFYINPHKFNDAKEVRISNHELFELLVLLSYLKENRYISIVSTDKPISKFDALYSKFDSSIKSAGNKITFNSEGDYLLKNQPDLIRDSNGKILLRGGLLNDYYDFIYENIFGLILPSEVLVDLVKHDFIPKGDRKHRQNLLIAWIGIAVAIILGILGIWNPFDNSQKEVKEELMKISNSIDSSKEEFIKSSTFQEKVLEKLIYKDSLENE